MAILCLMAMLVASGCVSGEDNHAADGSAGTTKGTVPHSTVERPTGPAAVLSQEITGGNGPFVGEAVGASVEDSGYVEQEYAASGTATSFAPKEPLSSDGRWTFEPAGEAAYRTRVLVRRPAKAADFPKTRCFPPLRPRARERIAPSRYPCRPLAHAAHTFSPAWGEVLVAGIASAAHGANPWRASREQTPL
jgi:hypothetical protein